MQSLECLLKDISAKKAAKKFIQRAGLIAILFSGGEEGSAQEISQDNYGPPETELYVPSSDGEMSEEYLKSRQDFIDGKHRFEYGQQDHGPPPWAVLATILSIAFGWAFYSARRDSICPECETVWAMDDIKRRDSEDYGMFSKQEDLYRCKHCGYQEWREVDPSEYG